jgi:hypothetical protein
MSIDPPWLYLSIVAWVGSVVYFRPTPLSTEWGYILLLFSPLVLVPVGLRIVVPRSGVAGQAVGWQLPCALLLVVSFALPAGIEAGLLSLPWLVVTALVCLEGLTRIWRRGLHPLHETCRDSGFVFLLVGGLWATASRAGIQPMGFDDATVLLTANHFHHAGFVLPIAAGLCGQLMPGRVSNLTSLGVLAGVPLVAIGITSTRYNGPALVEVLAVMVMAGAGIGTAWLHLRLAERAGPVAERVLWSIAGASLLFGMGLAALYGMRFYTSTDCWLNIPWMRALHGTANVFGFGLASLAGWFLWRLPRDAQ